MTTVCFVDTNNAGHGQKKFGLEKKLILNSLTFTRSTILIEERYYFEELK
jgi:hypothetical protein